jgi:phosphatidylinositol glycan class S
MLALLYFPAEHKYAVYTPLFASVAVPLLAAVGREVIAWRRTRRQKAGGEQNRDDRREKIG